MSTKMELVVFLNALLFLVGTWASSCNWYYGPAGSPECVLLPPYYSKHQWATCLTNKYIQTYSKGNHMCRDRSRTYCWYQCMVEIHHTNEGPVYDDCACGPDAPTGRTTLPTAVTPAIPNWCFSPSGDECSWYKDCLEKRYPCKKTGESYALDYAEKFCNLYKQHYSEFDTTGQQWIDAVRKCLQVNLVPILRPFVKKTCEEIKQMAFESHPGCYLNPDAGKPSICKIGCQNLARVFWTVKGAFAQTPVSTFQQMLEVKTKCSLGIADILRCGMELLQLKITQQINVTAERMGELLGKISDTFTDKLDWDNEGILHFEYPTNEINRLNKRSLSNTSDANVFYINILLAEQSQFDLNAKYSPVTNLSSAAIEAAKAVESGDVRLDFGEGIKLTELSVCVDYSCNEISLQVIPASPNTIMEENKTSSTVVICVCAIILALVAFVMRKRWRSLDKILSFF